MTKSSNFHSLCRKHKLAATHQRQVIYETVMSMHGHPSPELLYEKVKKKIPAISLATVYKNVRTFLDSGMLREVSVHHGSLKVEPNEHAHHHLVCIRCKQITDLNEESLGPLRIPIRMPLRIKERLRGFQVTRVAIDALGICAECARKENSRQSSFQTKRR